MKTNKSQIIIALALLSIFSIFHLANCQLTNGQLVDVKERCGGCYDSDCRDSKLVYNECTKYCPSCGVFCDGYYLLQEVSNSEENPQYLLDLYTDSDCTEQQDYSYMIACDSCYAATSVCAHYYLDCGNVSASNFVYYMLGFALFFGLIGIVGLALFAYLYNINQKRRYQTIYGSESYNVRYLDNENNNNNINNNNNNNNNNNEANESSHIVPN